MSLDNYKDAIADRWMRLKLVALDDLENSNEAIREAARMVAEATDREMEKLK